MSHPPVMQAIQTPRYREVLRPHLVNDDSPDSVQNVPNEEVNHSMQNMFSKRILLAAQSQILQNAVAKVWKHNAMIWMPLQSADILGLPFNLQGIAGLSDAEVIEIKNTGIKNNQLLTDLGLYFTRYKARVNFLYFCQGLPPSIGLIAFLTKSGLRMDSFYGAKRNAVRQKLVKDDSDHDSKKLKEKFVAYYKLLETERKSVAASSDSLLDKIQDTAGNIITIPAATRWGFAMKAGLNEYLMVDLPSVNYSDVKRERHRKDVVDALDVQLHKLFRYDKTKLAPPSIYARSLRYHWGGARSILNEESQSGRTFGRTHTNKLARAISKYYMEYMIPMQIQKGGSEGVLFTAADNYVKIFKVHSPEYGVGIVKASATISFLHRSFSEKAIAGQLQGETLMPRFNKELVLKTLEKYVLVPLNGSSISNGDFSPFYDARQLNFIRNLPKDRGGDPSLKNFAARSCAGNFGKKSTFLEKVIEPSLCSSVNALLFDEEGMRIVLEIANNPYEAQKLKQCFINFPSFHAGKHLDEPLVYHDRNVNLWWWLLGATTNYLGKGGETKAKSYRLIHKDTRAKKGASKLNQERINTLVALERKITAEIEKQLDRVESSSTSESSDKEDESSETSTHKDLDVDEAEYESEEDEDDDEDILLENSDNDDDDSSGDGGGGRNGNPTSSGDGGGDGGGGRNGNPTEYLPRGMLKDRKINYGRLFDYLHFVYKDWITHVRPRVKKMIQEAFPAPTFEDSLQHCPLSVKGHWQRLDFRLRMHFEVTTALEESGDMRPFLLWFPYIILQTIFAEKIKIARVYLGLFSNILTYMEHPKLKNILLLMAKNVKTFFQDVEIEYMNASIACMISKYCDAEKIVEMVGSMQSKRNIQSRHYNVRKKGKIEKRRLKYSNKKSRQIRIAMMARVELIFKSLLGDTAVAQFADTQKFFKIDYRNDILSDAVKDKFVTTSTGNSNSNKKIKRFGLVSVACDYAEKLKNNVKVYEKRHGIGRYKNRTTMAEHFEYFKEARGDAKMVQNLSMVSLLNFVKVYPKYFRGKGKLTRATLENKKTLISWITLRYPIILEITSEYSTFQGSIEKKFSGVKTNKEFLETYSFCKLHYKSDAV